MVGWEGMVEGCAAPGAGAVTLRALANEVVGRGVLAVAALAAGGALGGVVERAAGRPGGGAVTLRALV